MKKIFILFFIISSFSFSEQNIIHKIIVNGTAYKNVLPDTANITFQVKTENYNIDIAKNDNNTIIESFKENLLKNNIKIYNYETNSYSINKKYDSNDFKGHKERIKDSTNDNNIPFLYDIQLNFLIKTENIDNLYNIFENNDIPLQKIIKNYEENGFLFTINEKNKDFDTGLKNVFKSYSKIKDKLSNINIDNKEIVFIDYKVDKIYESSHAYEEKEKFVVLNEFTITIKNIEKINKIISIAANNNITINNGINFSLSNISSIQNELYQIAFENAKNNALNILRNSNMSITTPLIITEDINFYEKIKDSFTRSENISLKNDVAFFSAKSLVTNTDNFSLEFNYNPKPIKVRQNISIVYEMKEKEEK